MNNGKLAFSKLNYILIGIGMAVVILGFVLMITPAFDENTFSTEIFSARAIKVAPAVCFVGFIFMIYGIMAHGKKNGGAGENPQSGENCKSDLGGE